MNKHGEVLKYIDAALLAGVSRTDSAGVLVCGIKDLCDVLKNAIVVGSLLFACCALYVVPSSKLGGLQNRSLGGLGLAGAFPLAILLLGIVRQVYLVINNFPGCAPNHEYSGRAILRFLLFFLSVGVAVGMLALTIVGVAEFAAKYGT